MERESSLYICRAQQVLTETKILQSATEHLNKCIYQGHVE